MPKLEDQDLGALFETLKINRTEVAPMTPPFQGYSRYPEYWSWYGGSWPAGRYKHVRERKDIVYLDQDNKRHREYGPAYISTIYKVEEWYKHGLRHRIGAPAVIHNRNMVWYEEGKLHNLEGPAVIEGGGPKQYWIRGQRLSEKEFNKEIARRKRKGLIK